MKYRSIAIPSPSMGADFSKEVDQVVPDQSLSLKQILDRFTRGEPVPVGRETTYGSEGEEDVLDYDLEKLKHSDLTEREEVIESLREKRSQFEEREKQKAKAQKAAADKAAKLADEKRIRIAARKLAKQSSGGVA